MGWTPGLTLSVSPSPRVLAGETTFQQERLQAIAVSSPYPLDGVASGVREGTWDLRGPYTQHRDPVTQWCLLVHPHRQRPPQSLECGILDH